MVKKSQATKKSSNQAVSVSRIRLNKLILDSWLIIQGFLGIFVLLALSTFSPRDSGWNTQVFSVDNVDTNQISNAVGSWGAYLSEFFTDHIRLYVLSACLLAFMAFGETFFPVKE